MIIAATVFALLGANPSPAFQSPSDLQIWLTYYHREPRPELVVAALVALEDELPRHGSKPGLGNRWILSQRRTPPGWPSRASAGGVFGYAPGARRRRRYLVAAAPAMASRRR
mgnify:CR=1 FL=1